MPTPHTSPAPQSPRHPFRSYLLSFAPSASSATGLDRTEPNRTDGRTGLKKRMQAEMATKAATAPPNTDHRGKKIYDLKSKEAREIMAKQKVQGYTPDFAYVERVGYLDLYIPVPEVRRVLVIGAGRWSVCLARSATKRGSLG